MRKGEVSVDSPTNSVPAKSIIGAFLTSHSGSDKAVHNHKDAVVPLLILREGAEVHKQQSYTPVCTS